MKTKHILAILTTLLFSAFFGIGVEAATANHTLGIVAGASTFVVAFVPKPNLSFFTGIDISEIVSEFGAKYTNEGQTMKDIRKKLFSPSRTESFFMKRPEDNDFYKSVYATVDQVLQAFSIPFTKKSTVSFTPWQTKLGEFKIDASMEPDRFRNSYLGFLAQIAKEDRAKWDIIKWWLIDLLIPGSMEDFETEVAYWGWQLTGYNASPTVNGTTFVRQHTAEDAVHPANMSMDGIRIQLIKMVAANRATVINTGAWDADDKIFVGQVEDFVKSIEIKLQKKMDYIFFSKALRDRYLNGKREKYSMYYKDDESLALVKDTNVKVEWLESMDGSQKTWLTPANNRIRPTKKDNSGKFDIQKLDRSVKALTDWKRLLTFDVPEYVVTNDLENTITAGEITARY